jgi:hypothetical protein
MAASVPPGKPDTSGELPMPYEEITKDVYAQHAAANFTVEQVDGGAITMRGSCKRCHHVMEYLIGDVVRLSRWRRSSAPESPPAAAEETEHMVCTCEGEHQNQPENFRGCGAFWDLAISGR